MSKWLDKQREREAAEATARLIEEASEQPVRLYATEKTNPDRLYTVLSTGENIWDIARKLGLSGQELILHNNIKDPLANLPGGSTVHLPSKIKKTKPDTTRIEIKKQTMHVSNPEGAQKYGFGKHAKWTDISKFGRTIKLGTTVEIVATAHVPIEDVTAIFYLDSWALGNYGETGRLKHAVGFGFNDLSEGEYVEPEPVQSTAIDHETVEPSPPQQTVTMFDEPEQTISDDIIEKMLEPEDFRTTYRHFEDGDRDYVIDLPEDLRHKIVRILDYAENKPMFKGYHGDIFEFSGTFTKDGHEFARLTQEPSGRDARGDFFGVPINLLKRDSEYYNDAVETSRRMSKPEVAFSIFARTATTSLRPLLNKKIKIRQKDQK